MRRLLPLALLLVPLLLPSCAAAQQLRTIPKEAQRGEIRHLATMEVEIDGRPQPLSVGVQIRDAHNRLIVPTQLTGKSDAKYLLDGQGRVHRVWILTPEERAAEPARPPYLR